jgi:hypothetical protein
MNLQRIMKTATAAETAQICTMTGFSSELNQPPCRLSPV